ncbi:MAG: RnfH family protein, partial [Methylococcales bacterium]|nr:RnfH family protein [Methylococcales bacterium]
TMPVGIFGQRCGLNQLLKKGDRVEIYRPLICDPKVARRNRALLTQKKR